MKSRYLKAVLLVITALVIAVLICNNKGDSWEESVRTSLYKLTNDSVPVYSRELTDERGIPYVYYYELNGITAGKQYNPTIVCNYALNYYKQFGPGNHNASAESFFYCVTWLAEHMTYKNNHAFYQFNWQQPWYDSVGVPYTSGMTSGLAIQVFTDAYRLTKSSKYLEYAKALLNGYFVPVQAGGFTYTGDKGWWYEELADTAMHTPHILDGHIFAITGVYEYWLVTKDDSAAIIIDKGIQSLKSTLACYDIGNGWAYYDIYKKPADKKYQRILTAQMQQLYSISANSLFKFYYDKWNAPLSRPYMIRVIKEGNRSGIVLYFLVCLATWLALLVSDRFRRNVYAIRNSNQNKKNSPGM